MSRPIRTIMKGLDKYEIRFANGAYGGFGPQASLFVTFFMEHYLVPEMDTGILTDSGKPEMRKQGEEDELIIEREVVARLAFDLDTARRVHKWLGEHISTQEKASTKKNEGAETNDDSGSKKRSAGK